MSSIDTVPRSHPGTEDNVVNGGSDSDNEGTQGMSLEDFGIDDPDNTFLARSVGIGS